MGLGLSTRELCISQTGQLGQLGNLCELTSRSTCREVARVEKLMSMLLERGLLGAEDLAAGIGFNLHLADVFAAAFKGAHI